MESGTMASEMIIPGGTTANEMGPTVAQGPPKPLPASGTMATEMAYSPVALYRRNDWHYMTEMTGTMATELSNWKGSSMKGRRS